MRPGRKDDLPRVAELWQADARAGRQDATPNDMRLRRMLARFDWESQSRIVERNGRIVGAVLVTSRASPDGVIANVSLAGEPGLDQELARWGLSLSRASGARIVQLFAARGRRRLEDAGYRVVRCWLRMDRTLEDELPRPVAVGGYRLVDGGAAPSGAWGGMFNRSFADHWRYSPRLEDEIIGDKPPELCVMALTAGHLEPAAIALGELEAHPDDPRPQPVGLVSSVGTVPEHRRRGLALWLVAEVMARLKAAGARTASLYVDGGNEMRAFDAYRKLGFEVAFESEVWEASWS